MIQHRRVAEVIPTATHDASGDIVSVRMRVDADVRCLKGKARSLDGNEGRADSARPSNSNARFI